jgi:hypothetical protein
MMRAMPSTALSGVRISWLMLARKALLALLALSATSLARASSRVRASTRLSSWRRWLGQLLLVALLLGDVLLDAEVVGDAAIRAAYGRNDGRLHIDLPGLAPVDQLAPPYAPLFEGVPQIAEHVRSGVSPECMIRGFSPLTSSSV